MGGLVLTCGEGTDIVIGAVTVRIKEITSPSTFYLQHGPMEVMVTSDGWTHLFPGCKVRSTIPRGSTSEGTTKVRIQVDAPMLNVHRVRTNGY